MAWGCAIAGPYPSWPCRMANFQLHLSVLYGTMQVHCVLGFQITHNCVKCSMVLHQHPYVLKVLKHFQMENVKHICTPLPAGYQPSTAPKDYNASPTIRQRYQSVIGSLLFVMLGTCPDIALAVIKMSQFMANPTEEHVTVSLFILSNL